MADYQEILLTQEQATRLKATDLHRYVSLEFMTSLGNGPQQVRPGLRRLMEHMLDLAAGALLVPHPSGASAVPFSADTNRDSQA